jgi:hypothetical protein
MQQMRGCGMTVCGRVAKDAALVDPQALKLGVIRDANLAQRRIEIKRAEPARPRALDNRRDEPCRRRLHHLARTPEKDNYHT